MLLKTMIPFFDPIGITESKWVSEGNGMKLDDPIAASYAFLAIGKPYWNIETIFLARSMELDRHLQNLKCLYKFLDLMAWLLKQMDARLLAVRNCLQKFVLFFCRCKLPILQSEN